MSAKESILQTQPIFTHVIPQVAGQLDSLIIGVMITVDGIITFFARDTVVCKNPQGQGRHYHKNAFSPEGMPITNEALETVLSIEVRNAWLNCFSSLRGYLIIGEEHQLHSGLHPSVLPLADSKAFKANNHHMHIASPALLQPEVLKCILDTLAAGQADFERRQLALNSFFVKERLQTLKNSLCENNPAPIVDINRPAIPEKEMSKLIKAYSQFFEENKQLLLKAHNTTCTKDYLKHFPYNPIEANKRMIAQVAYFFSHIANTTYNAFFNAAIFSFIENILKECSGLEAAQISYLKNTVLLPAFISSDMGLLLFTVMQIAQETGELSQNGSTILTLGINTSIQLLQAESANDMTATTQVFSAIVGSVLASVAAGCTDVAFSSVARASKNFYSYFFSSSAALPTTPQKQQAAIQSPRVHSAY